mmetsp:Transcript_8299/g.21206  ORF Transcript_8299/g.21206 Transcript_8299/m.21206 type:complete len:165 (+) Transcript_8299:119-613(+)
MCKRVKYCGRDCQRKHWRAGHQEQCVEAGPQAAQARLAIQENMFKGDKNARGIGRQPSERKTLCTALKPYNPPGRPIEQLTLSGGEQRVNRLLVTFTWQAWAAMAPLLPRVGATPPASSTCSVQRWSPTREVPGCNARPITSVGASAVFRIFLPPGNFRFSGVH